MAVPSYRGSHRISQFHFFVYPLDFIFVPPVVLTYIVDPDSWAPLHVRVQYDLHDPVSLSIRMFTG
jgi:hypothetical protein